MEKLPANPPALSQAARQDTEPAKRGNYIEMPDWGLRRLLTAHLYGLLIVDVVGALSLCWKTGGLDVVDQPRHPARPPGPVVGQPPLACGEVEVVEGVLLSDLVVRLHGSPEVVVTLYCRG